LAVPAKIVRRTLEMFRGTKIMTLPQLTELLGCTSRTVHRRLKQWHCYTSYNHNSRYYALPEAVEFDGHGIWRFQGISFSRFGDLKKTVVGLIEASEAGLNSRELAALLGLNVHSFLSQFSNDNLIFRQKVGSRLLYLSHNPAMAEAQKERRLAQQLPNRKKSTLSDRAAVKVLIGLFKNPQASVEDLAIYLKSEGEWIDADVISDFLRSHDLLKKTSDTADDRLG